MRRGNGEPSKSLTMKIASLAGIAFLATILNGQEAMALSTSDCLEIGELGRQFAIARDGGISKPVAREAAGCTDEADKECQLMDDVADYAYAADDLDGNEVKLKIVEACLEGISN